MSLSTQQLGLARGERRLLHDVNMQLQPGEALRVAGENGSGKTSFLRILAGLALPGSGTVRWQGEDISQLREQYYAQILYLGHAQGVKDDLVAWENLVLSARLQGQRVSEAQAVQTLVQLGLAACVDLPVRALSQGQRKRVALARLHLGLPARLWILDEAFTALDVASVAQLLDCINRHLQTGGMLVYTTHQEVTLQAGQHWLLDLSAAAGAQQQTSLPAAPAMEASQATPAAQPMTDEAGKTMPQVLA